MRLIIKFLAVFILCILSSGTGAQHNLTNIKADFLFKFPHYITWPEETGLRRGGWFSLCVWGKHSFGKRLNAIAAEQTLYQYTVRYILPETTTSDCHIIFIASENTGMPKTDNTPLLISDRAGFLESGGMIEIYEDRDRIKLKANMDAIKNANLQVKSKLLEIMKVKK